MTNRHTESLINKYLQCSICGGRVILRNRKISCTNCRKKYSLIEDTIPDMTVDVSEETDSSLKKWDKLYGNKKYLLDLERDYKKFFLKSTLDQIVEFIPKNYRKGVFLELGSGTAFVGEEFAKNGWFFIGIDFSINSLLYLKKRFENHGIKNYLLIKGDIQNNPIKDNVIDIVYGGGVIEHFKNTKVAIGHLFRILKKGGFSFNSVPVFNIGNFVYRSKWGGIPNIPILKQIAEFIHIKVLKEKHMIFGYELQFTQNQLRKLHENSGFKAKNISITNFRCIVQLNGIKNKIVRKVLINLCNNNKNFWPGVKIIAYK